MPGDPSGTLARLRAAGLDPDAADVAAIAAAEAKLMALIETRLRPHAEPTAMPASVPALPGGRAG